MRDEKRLSAVIAVAAAFLVSFGCVGCVVTGFDMVADLAVAALWCVLAAVISGIFFRWKLDVVPLCGIAATGLLLWFYAGMRLSFQAVVYHVSRKYNAFYGWGVIRPLHYTAEMLAPETGLFLYFVGAVVAVLMTWAFSRKKMALPGMVVSVACVAACFLVQGTAPDAVWLWMFLFGFLLLVLTKTARRMDLARGNKLTLLAAVPLALFLLLLFVLIPQNGYSADKPAKAVVNAVLENRMFQAVFGDLTKKPGDVIGTDTGVVQLGAVGPQHKTYDEVFWVETDFSGRIYLRSRSFDTYNGVAWRQSGGEMSLSEMLSSLAVDDWPSVTSLEQLGTVQVTTRYAHKLFYIPYYAESMPSMIEGYIENAGLMTEYSYTVYKPLSGAELAAREQYGSKLPADGVDAFNWLDKQAYKLTKDKGTVYEKAQAIADYVRNSATYDLQTPQLPPLENNFVQWFLQDSDTGYCVHFASATAALLQMAEIPARYVNGYLVDVKAGEKTTVYTANAHAWAEYWLPGYGWTVLESTPAAQAEDAGMITQPEKKPVSDEVIAIIAAVTLLMTIVAVFVQQWIRLRLRQKKLTKGTLKQRALAYWQETVRFANCLEEAPAAGLLEIAERAKFSNHTMTEEDLEPFLIYLDSAKQRIRNHGFFRKLYYRFVLALY